MSLLVATEDTFSLRIPPVYETARREDAANANTETAHYYLQPVSQAHYRIVGLDGALIEPTVQLGFV
jgi:hypothetical protein